MFSKEDFFKDIDEYVITTSYTCKGLARSFRRSVEECSKEGLATLFSREKILRDKNSFVTPQEEAYYKIIIKYFQLFYPDYQTATSISAAPEAPFILRLPPEIIRTIASFLDEKSYFRSRRSCSFFHNELPFLSPQVLIIHCENFDLLKIDKRIFIYYSNNEELMFQEIFLPSKKGCASAIAQENNNILMLDSMGNLYSFCLYGSAAGLNHNSLSTWDFEEIIWDEPIAAIAGTKTHALIQTISGRLYARGDNEHGQLGLGNHEKYPDFFIVSLPEGEEGVVNVFTGRRCTFIVGTSGKLYACGDNEYGQLGLDDTEKQTTFQKIDLPNAKEGISKVITGKKCTFILGTSGNLYASGDNKSGQLGLADTQKQTTFTMVHLSEAEEGIASIVRGRRCTFIIGTSGMLYACGSNKYGQLGLEGIRKQTTFQKVTLPAGEIGVATVIAGRKRTFIFCASRRLYACGFNGSGQLGLGSREDQPTFQRVILPDDEKVSVISTGKFYTLLLCAGESVHVSGMMGRQKFHENFTLISQITSEDNLNASSESEIDNIFPKP